MAAAAAAAAAAPTTAVHRPRTLVSAWLLLSSFVVAWDVGYILLRPRSMLGGDLHWIWSPYSLYMNVDYIYGLPSWDTKDGFPAAQSLMNVGESILNLFYIYLVHVKATPAALAVAPVWGLVAVTMTLSKTILYVLNDFCCGWCKTGHNDWYTLIVYWILPNGLWILFPAIIAFVFIRELSSSLKVAAGVQGATTSVPSPSIASAAAVAANGDERKETAELGPNPFLVDHSQLPGWAQDNAWIVKGYRRPGGAHLDERLSKFDHGSVYKCWRSVWAYWHNETVNIHTHLWGAVFSVGLSTSHLLQHLNLLSSFIRPLSHHPIFYPSSLTFTTASGKVLRLASASYPFSSSTTPLASSHSLPSPPSSFLDRALSLFSTSSSAPSSTIATKLSNLVVRAPDTLDVAGFAAFFIGAVVCLGFSSTYHAIQCHSHAVAKQFNKLDYVGIIVMIVGSFLPALHYGFYCHAHWQLGYSLGVTALGALAMYVVLSPSYGTPAYRPHRTAVFLVLGLSAIVPTAHVVHVYGYATVTETMGLRFLILSGALYVVGALMYAARVPERFAPGRFDMLGASHQVFHVLILAAAAAHYVSIRRAYAFWHTVEALGGVDGGRAGVCAALQS
ncbi:related to Adiponectin receptor 1 [Sporisorium reilianum f. sp. reilianum]|uniref:Related to Adiponectin receptor 1 n=1 Tax=Sporisorium reilianum f. sp. reilianum TaxID=72559 RepID=A0A2N8UAS1_9BASI|nr:related to Adiponectin receptor 1 [Sporisorium reilianum f. sp. reilianum]